MSDGEPYKVGRNKPPLHTRFQKGKPSAKPRGSRKAGPIDVAGFFETPLSVVVDGKPRKMHPLESMVLSLLDKVVKKKDMRAAKRLIQMWAEVDLLLDPNKELGEDRVHYVSPAWLLDEWMEKYRQLGPPPWPGRKNGLNNPNWKEEILYDDD